MNSNVHPVVAALVLALTALAIGVWAWGNGEAAGFGGPAELRTGPDGHHYVQVQNHLVEHDTFGRYVRTHDLEALGVDVLLGGFDFFPNGDLLLRRGPDPRSFLDNLRAFQRQANRNSTAPESPDSGLFRCDLESRQCTRFGDPGVDFKAAYNLFIDDDSGEVYVSDTTRHQLRKYAADGTEIAGPVTGFKFPNKLILHEGQLLVADTNHHVVKAVEAGTADFGREIASNDVVPLRARDSGRRWPSHFARVRDEWWVNVMKTGMNEGGIYVFDRDWQFLREVDLPAGADPIAILAVGDEVWVSDWHNDVVRRFSPAGAALPVLESAGLADILEASRLERRKYQAYSYGGVGLIVLVLLGLLVRGFAVSMNRDPARRAASVTENDVLKDDGDILLEPDEKVLRRIARALRIAALMSVMIIVLTTFLLVSYGVLHLGLPLLLMTAGLLAIVLLIAWVAGANRGTSIRVRGDTLTLRDHAGRESSCPVRAARYDDTAVATSDAVVFLGRPPAAIYRTEDVRERLLPRLAAAEKVGPLRMMQILIQLRHPQGMITVVALVTVVVGGLVVVATGG